MKPSKKIVFLLLLLFILLLFISCSLVSRAGVLWRRSELLKTREGYVREYSYYTPPPSPPATINAHGPAKWDWVYLKLFLLSVTLDWNDLELGMLCL